MTKEEDYQVLAWINARRWKMGMKSFSIFDLYKEKTRVEIVEIFTMIQAGILK